MVEPRTFTEDPRTKYGSSRNNPETPSQADIATDSKRTGYDSWRIDHGLATDGHGLTTDYDEEATDNAGHMHREPTNKLYGCKTCEQATRMLPDFHRKAICITTDQTKKTKKKKKRGGGSNFEICTLPGLSTSAKTSLSPLHTGLKTRQLCEDTVTSTTPKTQSPCHILQSYWHWCCWACLDEWCGNT